MGPGSCTVTGSRAERTVRGEEAPPREVPWGRERVDAVKVRSTTSPGVRGTVEEGRDTRPLVPRGPGHPGLAQGPGDQAEPEAGSQGEASGRAQASTWNPGDPDTRGRLGHMAEKSLEPGRLGPRGRSERAGNPGGVRLDGITPLARSRVPWHRAP